MTADGVADNPNEDKLALREFSMLEKLQNYSRQLLAVDSLVRALTSEESLGDPIALVVAIDNAEANDLKVPPCARTTVVQRASATAQDNTIG